MKYPLIYDGERIVTGFRTVREAGPYRPCYWLQEGNRDALVWGRKQAATKESI